MGPKVPWFPGPLGPKGPRSMGLKGPWFPGPIWSYGPWSRSLVPWSLVPCAPALLEKPAPPARLQRKRPQPGRSQESPKWSTGIGVAVLSRCLGPLGAKRVTQVHFRSLFDQFWFHNEPKRYQHHSKIGVLSHVVAKNLPYDFWSEIRQNSDRCWCDSYTALVPTVIKKHCI